MKPVLMNELKARMLNSDASKEAYNEADKEMELLETLHAMREHANLKKSELARRMGVAQSAINRLEKNPLGASINTLESFARACGASISINVSYKQ